MGRMSHMEVTFMRLSGIVAASGGKGMSRLIIGTQWRCYVLGIKIPNQSIGTRVKPHFRSKSPWSKADPSFVTATIP